MEEFCGSAFWDSQLTWNTDTPFFTPCFESTVLTLLPAAFLLLFGFSDLLNIRNSKFKTKTFLRSFTVIGSIKAVLTLGLALAQLAELILLLSGSANFNTSLLPVDYISPSIQFVAYLVVLILFLSTQYFLIQSSAVQFFFWLLSIITQGLRFRTALLKIEGLEDSSKFEVIYLTTLICFPIIAVRFVLEFVNNGACQRKRVRLNNPSPENDSTFILRLLFFWYDGLAWTGFRRTLTQKDLWDLIPEDASRVQIEIFEKYWQKEVEKVKKKPLPKSGDKKAPYVLNPLMRLYGPRYALALFLKLTSDLLVFVQPAMLSLIVSHITEPTVEPAWKGFFYAGVICATFFFQSGLNAASLRIIYSVAMQARAALSCAVFRKSLVISNAAKRDSSMGEMVNLQSVDSQKILDLLPNLSLAFPAPFQILVAVVLLYQTLGWPVMAGVTILIAIVPLNMFIVAKSRQLQMHQMRLKDNRLKLSSEVLNGIKVLKMYAWEPAYQEQIEAIRQKEMGYIKKIQYLNVLSGFIFQSAPVLVSLAAFVTYTLASPENVLTADKTFVSINLFNIMRFPMILLPLTFSQTMQTTVSLKRISKFLNKEELDKSAVSHDESLPDPITMKDATLSWTKKQVTLKNINLNVKRGELVAVIGTIGAGKTSLLAALLGDLEKQSGIVNTVGDIAYVSQSAWIQNATVKDNILFGDKFDEQKYKRTVAACALEPDLKMLSDGDQTEIGEKGINLSGGQKQRVALARAAYKEAPVYLFDDPLSAVDSHVGKHIFEQLIGENGMLNKKTRILVTHAISFLPKVDRIVVMKDGEISECGTYRELIAKQGEFSEFLLSHIGIGEDEEADAEAISVVHDLEEVVGQDVIRRRSTANRDSIAKGVRKLSAKRKDKGADKTDKAPQKLITEEVSQEGSIKISVFTNYFASAGFLIGLMNIVFQLGGTGLIAVSNIWLSQWSTAVTEEEEAGAVNPATTSYYLTGYGLIGTSSAIAIFIANTGLALVCIAASKIIFSRSLAKVMRAPMSYFDTTPLGRIMNKFSRDMDILDNLLPINIRTFLAMTSNVFFALLVIAITIPIVTAIIVPIVIVYILLQRFYTATSRQLKRAEAVSRSPIFSYFGETISGASIVRAFRMEDDFVMESEKRVDLNQKSYFPYMYSIAWIGVRLEFLGVLTVLSTCIFTLLNRMSMDPGDAGLAISYALQVTTFLNFLARQTSELEANIVSAERMEELMETPQEPAWTRSDSKLAAAWPQSGNVIFENYQTRYREGLDLVLTGISCQIQPGEKVGVVGRTGAGKSSLTLALFRIIEAAGGKITIDGIDISTLALHELREKITIIPQDPVLFSGTLRLNLDPFNQYGDDQVWRCLELAHLKPYVSKLKDGLEYRVQEEGQNFSVGQRQLICLARALLRKTKILVLDEATAAVDLETDDLIQATIRKEFADCTVITIAHRLNTIVDSDRVMVLDKGQVKEFDKPKALMDDTTTIFYGMAKDAKIV